VRATYAVGNMEMDSASHEKQMKIKRENTKKEATNVIVHKICEKKE
jgi:hypothetical protein